ncbi:hypothetical protein BDN72DRAFT_901851 [Pluteus cervinus]|uniref:Uncharacterized protein n=1 Tax=Pluteus cervinus TaxID=181527 RepID=A0ACD3AEE0_9AGAR|nr:hypothetical protein BDN72DRAFT_901851 [Pluteus cervinus]
MESPTPQTSSPILTLPTELLARIFLFCVPMSFKKLSSDLGHVCKQWRLTALTTPELWASVVFSRPKWTSEMLIRARLAPLILRADLKQQSSEIVVPIITQNISRLRILELTAARSALTELLKDLISEAPALESLSLGTDQTPVDRFQIPDSILPQPTRNPLLWHLKLSGCAFAWDSPRYLQLTKLELHNISKMQRFNLSGLLGFLLLIPRLLDLVLVNSLPAVTEGSLIDLPYLTTLMLEDEMDRVVCVLRHLSFPDTVLSQFNLHTPSTWSREEEFYGLLRKLYPRINQRNLTFSLTCSNQTLSFALIKESGRSIISFSVSGRSIRYWSSWSFAKLVTIFPPVNIKTLILGTSTTTVPTTYDKSHKDDLGVQMNNWALLSTLAGVETLHILDHPPVMFLECLLERAMNCIGVCVRWSTSHVGPDGQGRQFLPRLKNLTLSGVNFSRPMAANCPTVYEVIISYLWARKRFGSPLISARLEGSCLNIYREDLARLEYMVDVTFALRKDGLPTGRLLDFEYNPQAAVISVFTRLQTLLILRNQLPEKEES